MPQHEVAVMRMVSRILSGSSDAAEAVPWRSGSVSRARAVAHKEGGALATTPHAQAAAELEASLAQQVQAAYESGMREGDSAARRQLESEVRQAVEQFAQAA